KGKESAQSRGKTGKDQDDEFDCHHPAACVHSEKGRIALACIYAVAARSRQVLSTESQGRRSNRFSHSVLGGNWLRLWQLFPRWIQCRPALSRIFLSWRAGYDRSLYFNLHNDVRYRRSKRGI